MEVLTTGLGNNNEGTTHDRDDNKWQEQRTAGNNELQGMTNHRERQTAGNDKPWGTTNCRDDERRGTTNRGDDEWQG
jgi:hypothetical protein